MLAMQVHDQVDLLNDEQLNEKCPLPAHTPHLTYLSRKQCNVRGNHATASKGADSTKLPKLECELARKGLALARASQFSETALAGSRRVRQRQSFTRMLLSQ